MRFSFNLAPDFFLRWNARNIILIACFNCCIFFSYLSITAYFGNNKKSFLKPLRSSLHFFFKSIYMKVIIKLIFIKVCLCLFKHIITYFWFLLIELQLKHNYFFLAEAHDLSIGYIFDRHRIYNILHMSCNILKMHIRSFRKSILLKEETDFIEPQLLWNHTKSEICVIWRIAIVYCTS